MPKSRPECDDETLSKPLRKWRKPGELDDLKMRVWRAVRAAERVMYDERSTRSEVLKAATTMQQSARTYVSILEADDLLERIEALEAGLESSKW